MDEDKALLTAESEYHGFHNTYHPALYLNR